MQDKKVQCPFLAAKSGEDPGRMVNLSWVGGGGEEECHGPTVTGFTLLRLPCQEL